MEEIGRVGASSETGNRHDALPDYDDDMEEARDTALELASALAQESSNPLVDVTSLKNFLDPVRFPNSDSSALQLPLLRRESCLHPRTLSEWLQALTAPMDGSPPYIRVEPSALPLPAPGRCRHYFLMMTSDAEPALAQSHAKMLSLAVDVLPDEVIGGTLLALASEANLLTSLRIPVPRLRLHGAAGYSSSDPGPGGAAVESSSELEEHVKWRSLQTCVHWCSAWAQGPASDPDTVFARRIAKTMMVVPLPVGLHGTIPPLPRTKGRGQRAATAHQSLMDYSAYDECAITFAGFF